MPHAFANSRYSERISAAYHHEVRPMNKLTKQKAPGHIRIVHAVQEPAARPPAPTSHSHLDTRRADPRSTASKTTDSHSDLSPFLPLDWDYTRVHALMPGHSRTESDTPSTVASKRASTRTLGHGRGESYGWSLTAEVVVLPPRQSSMNWRSEDSSSSSSSLRTVYRSDDGPPKRLSSRNWKVHSISSTPSVYQQPTFVERDSDSSSYGSSSSISTPSPSPRTSRISTISTASTTTPIIPTILPAPELASFDRAIRPGHITRLIFWYLYYDLIEPPSSSSTWYSKIPGWELSGWLLMGSSLLSTPGLTLKGLSTMCAATEVDEDEVRHLLMRLASSESMERTEIKELVDLGRAAELSYRAIAAGIKAKLEKDLRLLRSLYVRGSGCGVYWPYMQDVLMRRARDYLVYVVRPTLERRFTVAQDARERDAARGVLESYWRLMDGRDVPRDWYEEEMGDWETVKSFI